MRRLILREGWKIETVARRCGVHHSTVRRALADIDPTVQATPSALESFKPYIVERLVSLPELTAVRLFEELQEKGYTRGIAILRRYVAKVRAPRHRKAYLRIELDPGEQTQVDWGSFGHFRIGVTQRPLSAFVMTLSYSRAMFIDFALDQRMETFLAMHRARSRILRRCPKTRSLRQLEIRRSAPRRQRRAVQPAISHVRWALPLRAQRRTRALSASEGPR
jgi:transposase